MDIRCFFYPVQVAEAPFQLQRKKAQKNGLDFNIKSRFLTVHFDGFPKKMQ